MTAEPTLSLYTSHDRDLLFHGSVDEAKAQGIKLHNIRTGRPTTWEVTFKGKRRRVVNHHFPAGGNVYLWLANP